MIRQTITLLCIAFINPAIAQEIKFTFIAPVNDGPGCRAHIENVVISNDSLFDHWSKSCGWEIERPDFSKYVILGATYTSDCHMQIEPHVYKDDTARTITLLTTVYYGGCRAGGWRELWVIFEKPDNDYQYVFNEINIDK